MLLLGGDFAVRTIPHGQKKICVDDKVDIKQDGKKKMRGKAEKRGCSSPRELSPSVRASSSSVYAFSYLKSAEITEPLEGCSSAACLIVGALDSIEVSSTDEISMRLVRAVAAAQPAEALQG